MSAIMADWRAKKAQEEEQLHERLCTALRSGQVEFYTDQRMLDFQGSPIHNAWDHLAPLLGLMCLALAILLATGSVAIGIVAMTFGALGHLVSIKHFVAWRIRARAKNYAQYSAAHLNQLWNMGGLVVVMKGGTEPPCVAPRGDWRKFVKRNLPPEGMPAPISEAAAEEIIDDGQEILPP
ncbi:MAG: hypothetical protein H7Z12_06940 [Rhodospirillaceae bacterium]|nr:hypothetical protein [Rhodospirillales bacterium]